MVGDDVDDGRDADLGRALARRGRGCLIEIWGCWKELFWIRYLQSALFERSRILEHGGKFTEHEEFRSLLD